MARKEKNIHYIYKTTCDVTGKYYVGMHSTTNENDGYMGSGLRLRRSIRKYGPDNHTKEILEYCDSRENLVLREIEIVNSDLIQDENCMNLKEGGEGGFSSEEHKQNFLSAGNNRIRELLKDSEYKKEHCFRFQKAIKNAILEGKIKFINENYSWEGKLHSKESKQLMSEKASERIGEKNSQYGTCWITKDGINKKIKKDDLNSYTNDGWIQGRKY